MGSFLTRCSVTQQIISENDRVRFVPIIANSASDPISLFDTSPTGETVDISVHPSFTSTIYFNAFWEPVGKFMTGTYADCGRFEIEETPDNKVIFMAFIKTLAGLAYQTRGGKNPYHDLPVNIPALIKEHDPEKGWAGIHSLWEAIHEFNHDNRIYCRHDIFRGAPRMLQTAVIREDVWMTLAAAAAPKIDKQWKELELMLANPEAAVDASLAKSSRKIAEDNEAEFRSGYFEFLIREKLERLYGRGEGSYNVVRPTVELYTAAQMLVRGDLPEIVRALVGREIEESGIKTHLSDLGVKLLPHAYAGQDYSNESGTKLAMMALRVMIKGHQDRMADYYNDEFFDEEPEPDEDAYAIRDRKRAALYGQLGSLLTEIETLSVDEDD